VESTTTADVDICRIEVDVGEPGAVQRSGEELLDGFVDVRLADDGVQGFVDPTAG
jgi:hypothetical protein